VADRFYLRDQAGGSHRSADRAGSAGVASWASQALRIAGDVVAGSAFASCRAGATADAGKALLLMSCRGGQLPGTAAWGFNSVSWGFNSAFMVIWTGLRGRSGGAEMQGSSGRLSPRFLMSKRSEAAAAVRPDPALQSLLVVLAGHRAGLIRQAGAAATFSPWIAARSALFVLAWNGDRSPFRGCVTTGRDRVPLGHVKSP